MENLFATQPLAERMRPRNLSEVVGQQHLLAPGGLLTKIAELHPLPSLIFWGPPGSGKTTIAKLLGEGRDFFSISAVMSGVAELRRILDATAATTSETLLFVDEIHRWNKSQQDALLPHVESGRISLIGATTENPSFSLIAPLLSRARVLVLRPLTNSDLRALLLRALSDTERGLGRDLSSIEDDALEALIEFSNRDARAALNTLEMLAQLSQRIHRGLVAELFGKKVLRHDKGGEAHYDTISAFIKSMRASDPTAALHYLARMYEAGEDPYYILRRMIIFASEDIGNADPRALEIALAGAESFERIGLFEGWIPLSQVVCYLATAPKSRASYDAYGEAREDLDRFGDADIPMHLRNAPTALMKELGYGKGAKGGKNLPEKMPEREYYKPSDKGFEKIISERLAWVKEKAK